MELIENWGMLVHCFKKKTIFCSKKQRKQEKDVWFQFFFFLKNIKSINNTKIIEQRKFLNNTFLVFFVFLNYVLNNNFKKQESNRVLCFSFFL